MVVVGSPAGGAGRRVSLGRARGWRCRFVRGGGGRRGPGRRGGRRGWRGGAVGVGGGGRGSIWGGGIGSWEEVRVGRGVVVRDLLLGW